MSRHAFLLDQEKENELAKIVMKGNAFLLDPFTDTVYGRGAGLPFFCVSATVQYLYSIVRRNPAAYARYLPNPKLLICGAYFLEAVSTIYISL